MRFTTETDSVGTLIPSSASITKHDDGYTLSIEHNQQVNIPELYIEMWVKAPDYDYFDILKPTDIESDDLNLIQLKDKREVTISMGYTKVLSADSAYHIKFNTKK